MESRASVAGEQLCASWKGSVGWSCCSAHHLPSSFSFILRLPFSAFHRAPLCDSAAQVQLRQSPHEIKNTEEYKSDRTDSFLEGGVIKAWKDGIFYFFMPKEETKLHLDLFIKSVYICSGRRMNFPKQRIRTWDQDCIFHAIYVHMCLFWPCSSPSEFHKKTHWI